MGVVQTQVLAGEAFFSMHHRRESLYRDSFFLTSAGVKIRFVSPDTKTNEPSDQPAISQAVHLPFCF